jgi:hypothetical protein
MNMIKVPYLHVWKCHSETPHFVQLIHAHKKFLKKKLQMCEETDMFNLI